MRVERIIYSTLIVVSAIFAAINWRKATLFQADNEQMRARLDDLEAAAEKKSNEEADLSKAAAEKVRTQTSELLKLRNEVTQLRSASNKVATLTTENQRLLAENKKLRSGGAVSNVAAPPSNLAGRDQFPRDSWSFAGYASPEAALVSALWAMKQGDPKTYLDSLSPDEQKRTAMTWQNKPENEIAEKHKSDVSSIASLRVLDRQNVSPNEMVMNVYLEGPGRMEKVRMNQVGQDWKFGGFIRNQQPPAAQ
jgi:hypothetical protein